MQLTAIVPAHNPHPGRLRRTLLGLRAQTLPDSEWETVLVNNSSTHFPDRPFFDECAPKNFRLVSEPTLGLAAARRCGFGEARGEFAVLVDDDNVLARDYLARVLALFAEFPRVGALGGKSLPEFERQPTEWAPEFFGLLALRDLGPAPLISRGLRAAGTTRNEYPAYAPLGAGMALRREAWAAWLETRRDGFRLSDRRGDELSSSGDNDIILALMSAGWEVAYFPDLLLTHLIPAARLEASYLARLNYGIQNSWMQVLALHDANPWPPLSPLGALLRKIKAWFVYHGWKSPAPYIRWRGVCGHFDGRVPR